MLEVGENGITLCKFYGGTAELCTLERTLLFYGSTVQQR